MFIVIEGIDGCGKSTQARRLAVRMPGSLIYGFPDRDRLPLGPLIGEYLQRHEPLVHEPLILQSLMIADRYHAAVEIGEALAVSFKDVIVSRWWPAALVYGTVDGLNPVWLEEVHRNILQADLYVLIDMPPEAALRRRPEMRDRFERDRAKQERIRQLYLELWGAHRFFGDWVTVDGATGEDAVHEAIWSAVRNVKAGDDDEYEEKT